MAGLGHGFYIPGIGKEKSSYTDAGLVAPQIEFEALVDAFNTLEIYVSSRAEDERQLRTARLAHDRMVAWFGQEGTHFRSVLVSLEAPRTVRVSYSGKGNWGVAQWNLHFCSSNASSVELQEQIDIAVSKAQPVYDEAFKRRIFPLGY